MQEIELLLGTLTREAMIDICKKFKVQVDGFQKKLDGAQTKHIGISLQQAMKSASLGKKKKGGITPVRMEEIIDYLYQKTVNQFPYIKEYGLDEMIVETEQNPDFLFYQGIIVLYKQFPEVYEGKFDQLMKNKDNKAFIFEGLSEVTCCPTIDKINGVIYSSYEKKTIKRELEDFKVILETLDTGAIHEFTEKLKEGTEEEFFEQFRKVKKEYQQEIILAFLLNDNKYKNKEYLPLVLHALLQHNLMMTKAILEKESEMEEEVVELKKQVDEKTIELEKAKQKIVELTIVEKQYQELKTRNEKTEEAKNTAEWKIKKCEPFVQYFYQLGDNHNIIIVTNERKHFLGTPLERYIYSCADLAKDKKKKDLTRIEGKHLFITRVSFSSTPEWMNLTNFLEKNKVTYNELSGYYLSDYIEEITQVLHRRESISYDYNV